MRADLPTFTLPEENSSSLSDDDRDHASAPLDQISLLNAGVSDDWDSVSLNDGAFVHPVPITPSYAVATGEIAISYGGQQYAIPWGNSVSVSNFYIRDLASGSIEQVQKDVAAELFGASKAYSLLNNYYDHLNVLSSINDWLAVYNSVASVLGWQIVADLVAKASGVFLGSIINPTDPEQALGDAFIGALKGVRLDQANLAAGALVLADAAGGLHIANHSYQDIESAIFINHNFPIPLDVIQTTADQTLTSLATGAEAATAIGQLGNSNQSWWDTTFDYFKNFYNSLVAALTDNATGAIKTVVDITSGVNAITDGISTVSSEASYFHNLLTALTTNKAFPQLTAQGIQTLESQMTGASYILPSNSGTPATYSIVPGTASITENGGTLYLHVTRTGTAAQLAQAVTVDAYTLQNFNGNGEFNKNPVTGASGNYYYQGLDDQFGNNKFTFASGVATITVPITINDLHLSSGSETFGVEIVSTGGTFLQGSSFTIYNTDTTETYGLTANALFATESGPPLTFTLTRNGNGAQETVYVSTVDNLGVSNPNDFYYTSLNHFAVTFLAGASSVTVAVAPKDVHLTSGSETFNLVVQKNSTDSTTNASTYLSSVPFTITDNDTDPQALAGNISGTVTRTGITTINRADVNLVSGADLRNSGSLTIGTDGFVTADTNAANRIDNLAGATLTVQASSSIEVETFNNDGRLVASPGSGNTVIFGGLWFPASGNPFGSVFNDTGAGKIEVDSGTLQLDGSGSITASAFSVASGATLLLSGGGVLNITSGTFNVVGTTAFGDQTTSSNVVFASGTTIDSGGVWSVVNGIVDLSSALISGAFPSFSLGARANVTFGSTPISVANFSIASGAVRTKCKSSAY